MRLKEQEGYTTCSLVPWGQGEVRSLLLVVNSSAAGSQKHYNPCDVMALLLLNIGSYMHNSILMKSRNPLILTCMGGLGMGGAAEDEWREEGGPQGYLVRSFVVWAP
jgi:hypothetical protein